MLVQITCDQCGWWCTATIDAAPNDPNILSCNCCSLWHDHSEAAALTGVACRPVTVMLLDTPLLPADPAPW